MTDELTDRTRKPRVLVCSTAAPLPNQEEKKSLSSSSSLPHQYSGHVRPSNDSKQLSRLSPCRATVSWSAASCASAATSIPDTMSRRAMRATPRPVTPERSARSSAPPLPPPPPPPAASPPPGRRPLRSAVCQHRVLDDRLVHGGGEFVSQIDAGDGVRYVEGDLDRVLGREGSENLLDRVRHEAVLDAVG